MADATLMDVARLAGVSAKTVSRVVNDQPAVREATRERVHRAIEQLNYEPNEWARQLAHKRVKATAAERPAQEPRHSPPSTS